MRKIISLFILLFLSVGVFAQTTGKGVKWEEGTFAQIIEKAKKAKKPIFLDCYTSWCGPCKHMANNVFTLPEAGKFFNSEFINVKIDMEKGEGITLKEKYAVKAFPTFIILDSSGNEIGRIVGGEELEPFIGKVKKAMSAENSPIALKAKYDNSKNPDDAIAYMQLLESSYMQSEIVKFVEDNFSSFGRATTSEQMWKYIAIGLESDYVYDKVMAQKYDFDENVGRGVVNGAISEMLYNKLVAYLTGKLTLTKEQVKSISKDLAFTKEGRNLMLTKVVSAVALAYSQGDNAAIEQALNMNFLDRRLTGHERFMLNAFVLQKGIFLTGEQKEVFKSKIK